MDAKESEVNACYGYGTTRVFAYPPHGIGATRTSMSPSLFSRGHPHPSASSSIITRSDFKSSALRKASLLHAERRLARTSTLQSGAGGVYLGAWETNVRVRWQACLGLGASLISCPITFIHLLKKTSAYPPAPQAPPTWSRT